MKAWIFNSKPFDRFTVLKNKQGKDLLQLEPVKLRNGQYFISDAFYQANKKILDRLKPDIKNVGRLVTLMSDAFLVGDITDNFDPNAVIIKS